MFILGLTQIFEIWSLYSYKQHIIPQFFSSSFILFQQFLEHIFLPCVPPYLITVFISAQQAARAPPCPHQHGQRVSAQNGISSIRKFSSFLSSSFFSGCNNTKKQCSCFVHSWGSGWLLCTAVNFLGSLYTKDSVQCLSTDEMRGPAEFMRKTSNYVMDYGRSYSIMGDLLAYS